MVMPTAFKVGLAAPQTAHGADGLKYSLIVEQHCNGKKQIEMQTIEFKFLDNVEEGTFDKPSPRRMKHRRRLLGGLS